MQDSKVQISSDTWVYVDENRAKLIVEIDLPKEGLDRPVPEAPVTSPEITK